MFRFEHPAFFWLAALVAGMIILYLIRLHLTGRDWKQWGSEASNQRANDHLMGSPRARWMSLTAAMLLIIAAANPQWGYRSVAVESKSADIYLALDISTSMLAEDLPPSRLERAKRIALSLSTTFQSDRVGLILFAGNAYMQSPLTTDWHAIQLFLNAAHPDQAGTQGTAIGEAIRLVLNTEGKAESSEGAIIILTDGEDHDGDAPAAVADAAAAGWMTCIVGVGTEAGATIPEYINGQRIEKRDSQGQPVVTKLNRALMMLLAQEGTGKYFDASLGAELPAAIEETVANLERTQLENRSFTEHRSYFQWFLLPALILIFSATSLNYKFDVI